MNKNAFMPLVIATVGIGIAPMSTASASPARCTTAQLKVHLGTGSGAAGSVYAPIVWTNKSTSACTLFGYPGVAYVAPSSGNQVGAAATRNPQHPATTVTVKPGGHASALLQMVDYQNYPKSNCKATPVSGIRVYPPGSRSAEFVAFIHSTKACSTNVHQLSVEATVKGASGQ
jgi:hypothetical protein